MAIYRCLRTADMVQRAVEKGVLTDEQCSAILAEEV